MKSYTDIEQSKVLAKILPSESADMVFVHSIDIEGDGHYDIALRQNQPLFEDDVCAWSLAALLSVFPTNKDKSVNLFRGGWDGNKYISKWFCTYEIYEEGDNYGLETTISDNTIDTCYEMILKLHKFKML